MDVGTFEDLIDRLGEDLSLWPDAQRVAAAELLASSADARVLYDEAQTLRLALAGPPVRAPAGLADRIVAAAGKLKADSVAAPADPGTTTESVAGSSGKVLPVLLLALYLLPLLAMSTTAECEDPAATRICARL